jgi:hypothetical protein
LHLLFLSLECRFQQSKSDPPVCGWRFFLLLRPKTHCDKYPALPHSSRPAWYTLYLVEQSDQKAKPKQHCGEAQNCQR